MNDSQTLVGIPVPKVVKELPVNKKADTNDWDTVFAIRFKDANTSITNNWSKVSDKAKNVAQTASDDPSYKLEGVLGPWQLAMGGDGKNIRMSCPFKSGTFTTAAKQYKLDGVEVIIQVGMEWVPDPDQFAFSIGGDDTVTAITNDLDNSTVNDLLKKQFEKNGKKLDKPSANVLTKGKDWLVTDGKNNYYIFFYKDKFGSEFLQVYQFEDAWKNNLKILKDEISESQPAVILVAIKNDPTKGVPGAVLQELLSEWFNTNIGEFNHVFSSLDLSPALSAKGNYSWIKPTGTSYAVTDNGTLDNSVFGVLTMTQGNQAPASHQVSPNAIPDKDGVNAGFLISGTMFMKKMMLAGARITFDNEPETSFDVTNDGLTVTNNKELTWGRFKKDDKPMISVKSTYSGDLDNNVLPDQMIADLKGKWIAGPKGTGHWEPGIMVAGYSAHATAKGSNWYLKSADGNTEYLLEMDSSGSKINMFHSMVFKIQARQFKMSLDNSYLEIQFIDLKYPESWEYDVHINYTEQLSLGLADILGKKIFSFDQVTRDMTVSVTKTQASITASIVEDSIMAAIGLIAVVAPLIDGLRAAASIVEVTEDAGNAVITSEKFVQVSEDLSEIEQEINEIDGVVNAAEQVRGGWPAFKNAFTATRWKVLGGIAAIIGAGVATQAVVTTIMEAIGKGQWEKVPAFDEFADAAIYPYSWPGVDSYDLKNAILAGSLQIGLKTQNSKA